MNVNFLKEKYKKLSLPVKASLWYTICNILNKGIALFSTPVFTRILSEEQYGSFSIFQSWYGILIIFTSLNIFLSSYQKGLLLYKNDQERFTSSQLALTTTITVLCILIYLTNVDFWGKIFDLPPVLMLAMFIELITMPALEFWSARERFEFKYKKYAFITIIMSAMSIGLGIFFVLHTKYKLEARIFSDVFSKIIFAFPLFIFLIKKGKVFYVKKYWKYAILFNLPLIPHYLSNYVLSQSDRLMIGRMVGNTQAAFYSVSYTIATMMLLVTTAINNSLTPYIYKCIDAGKTKNIAKATKLLVTLVGILCIVTMIFAPEIILIFAGTRYLDSIYVIPPIAVSVFFIFIYSLFSNIEYFYEKTGFIAVATCVSAGLNLLLNYIFINKYGYYAAGYTTLICYICLAFMHYVFYNKILKKEDNLQEIYDIRFITLASICVIFIMMIMVFTYKLFYVRYFMIIMLIAIAVIKRKKIRDIFNKYQKEH